MQVELHRFFQIRKKMGWYASELGDAPGETFLTDSELDAHARGWPRVLYRPFDSRVIFFTFDDFFGIASTVKQVMRHMLAGKNLALVCPKQHKDEFGWVIPG